MRVLLDGAVGVTLAVFDAELVPMALVAVTEQL